MRKNVQLADKLQVYNKLRTDWRDIKVPQHELRCSRSVWGTKEYVDILTDVKQYKRRLSFLCIFVISVRNTTCINKTLKYLFKNS